MTKTKKNWFRPVSTGCGSGFLIFPNKAAGCGCWLPVFGSRNRTGPDLRTLHFALSLHISAYPTLTGADHPPYTAVANTLALCLTVWHGYPYDGHIRSYGFQNDSE